MTRSAELYEEARDYLPGGVNSPVRAFGAVGGAPRFIARGEGAYVWDADGQRYVDFLASWGPLIAGHAHPEVLAAIQQAAARGTSYGASTEAEVRLAREVREAFPSVELVRFVSSGTEATMSALRLARAYTGRDRVLKFDGGYHGHADSLLVQAGSGPMTLGVPASAGVPAAVAALTLSVEYNDAQAVERAFAAHPGEIAAVIVEPVAGNMGVVPPAPGFLETLREITQAHGTVLIFDEVITGFRVARGGAQERFGVTPDLTCLGKILGGGLPVGAFGGRREIMEMLAPLGPVYQAGTLSGNPLAMEAGLATLAVGRETGAYGRLEQLGAMLETGLCRAAADAGVAGRVNRVGSMLTYFFADALVTSYATAKQADAARYAGFFRGMLERGIFLPPSQFEAFFVSLSHTEREIEMAVEAASDVFREIAGAPG